ncbi:G2/M phase-specific E3 ubiquitin-protein ligase [Pseudolycoriella hygida]|uniref:G2/M phase-specific E3 ubiquitin-protein ligase n=1 Tax=Pseudolycoriella hygida TaxID=35572 RepID=A0A9Q0N0C6_9DIPT|nr:G2/M phase-specific E3 ubiquitin-protein ligase [Pseudolycoriella hygida]
MSERPCVLCNHSIDDALQFGEKTTFEDITAHYYCLLLASNLVNNGEDEEGINGFMPKDIKSDIRRTIKLRCYYCKGRSATIGCCVRSCRRSFHLPCGLKNDCQFEFFDRYRSFCEEHRTIEEPKVIHQPTDLCTICYDEMGQYNLIKSIPLPCCNKNAWCHKLCLQKYAQTSGYFMKCPLCNNSNTFCTFIAKRGVFIPDRDAEWENESGPSTFYGFEQHNERPSVCVAKQCKCSRGRRYHVDRENHKYSFKACQDCGSHVAHFGCFNSKEFRCDVCATVWQD